MDHYMNFVTAIKNYEGVAIMQKNILITGATDGIGLEAARMLAVQGHNLIIHGRNPVKLADVEKILSAISPGAKLTSYLCDLSEPKDVEGLGAEVAENHTSLDVLINNAGVFKDSESCHQRRA